MTSHAEFVDMVMNSDWIANALQACSSLGMPDFYVAGGAVAQVVWNQLCGNAIHTGIKDIDIAYFESSHSRDSERLYERTLNDMRPQGSVPFDVKNQALVHTWYEKKFGRAIEPFFCAEDGIDTWVPAVAVGIRPSATGYRVYAPFGLGDLLAMRVRPNKKQMPQDSYQHIATSLSARWPQLKVESWEADLQPEPAQS